MCNSIMHYFRLLVTETYIWKLSAGSAGKASANFGVYVLAICVTKHTLTAL